MPLLWHNLRFIYREPHATTPDELVERNFEPMEYLNIEHLLGCREPLKGSTDATHSTPSSLRRPPPWSRSIQTGCVLAACALRQRACLPADSVFRICEQRRLDLWYYRWPGALGLPQDNTKNIRMWVRVPGIIDRELNVQLCQDATAPSIDPDNN